jgi:hypothetical protein
MRLRAFGPGFAAPGAMMRSVLFLAAFSLLSWSDLAEAGRRSRTDSSSGSYGSGSRSSSPRSGHRAVVPRTASPGGHRSVGPTLSSPRAPRRGDELRRGEPPREPGARILPRAPFWRKRAGADQPRSRSPGLGKSGIARCRRRPPPPQWSCVLPGPQRHHAEGRCAYFCLVHCAYHLPSPGATPHPEAGFGEAQAQSLPRARRGPPLLETGSGIPLLSR